jgi:hypothetical protein
VSVAFIDTGTLYNMSLDFINRGICIMCPWISLIHAPV